MSTLLGEAIRNMSGADLLRAFENPRWGRGARELIRAELLRRLDRSELAVYAPRRAVMAAKASR